MLNGYIVVLLDNRLTNNVGSTVARKQKTVKYNYKDFLKQCQQLFLAKSEIITLLL